MHFIFISPYFKDRESLLISESSYMCVYTSVHIHISKLILRFFINKLILNAFHSDRTLDIDKSGCSYWRITSYFRVVLPIIG